MSPTTNAVRSDEQIKVDVVDELRWDQRVDASRVKVTAIDGGVTLTGSVPTANARLAAGDAAWFVTGVKRVENQLLVELPQVDTMPDDAAIRSRVEQALAWSADLESSNLSVRVSAGVVTLEGTVPTHWEKTRAGQLARGMLGVIAVQNELAVVLSNDLEDEVIAEDIVAALERNVLIDAADVDVTVSLGTVTLAGSVPSAAARQTAEDVASRTLGVVAVRNELLVVV
jgi:osmotically-inducible protein OsmY